MNTSASIRRRLLLAIALAASAIAAGVPTEQREFDYVLDKTPDLARGAVIFETCAACHGMDGGGVSDGSVPAIAGQHYKVIAKQLVDFRQGQRADVRMQHFADVTHLSYSQEVADVSAYASCLAPKTSAAAKPAIPHEQGARIYEKSCVRCHGAEARGMDSWLVPSLAGQHVAYLTKQLQNLELRAPLRQAHADITTPLDARGIEQVSSYLAALIPKPVPQTKERNALCSPSRASGKGN